MQQGLIKVMNSAHDQGMHSDAAAAAAAAAAMAVVRQLASVLPGMMQAITASGQPALLQKATWCACLQLIVRSSQVPGLASL